jgi:hypothetical protein
MKATFSKDERLLTLNGVNYTFVEGVENCPNCALDYNSNRSCPRLFTEAGVNQKCVSSTRRDGLYGHWVIAP